MFPEHTVFFVQLNSTAVVLHAVRTLFTLLCYAITGTHICGTGAIIVVYSKSGIQHRVIFILFTLFYPLFTCFHPFL